MHNLHLLVQSEELRWRRQVEDVEIPFRIHLCRRTVSTRQQRLSTASAMQ